MRVCDTHTEEIPDYEARRALLARDPLACAYGFQVLVLLALRHIFGLRFCFNCPDCATSAQPCTDAFGSNATASGGVFGRIDAAYGSLECQRSGAFHLHCQFFVQCFHQFRPLSELQSMGREPLLELLRKYSDYSAHVRRMVYCNPEAWQDKQQEVEEGWPEYKHSTLMLSKPDYQTDGRMAPADWRLRYLAEDVEALQMHKQHHVHIMDSKGVRQPLNHCRDPKDPSKCKANFPREKWLTEEPYLICPKLAQQKDMPHKGKKSMTGLPWGPCNDPNLNGNHPALLATLRCNGDVQLPFRFPITPETHDCELCQEKCDQELPLWKLIQEAQINQAAQAGYACDYQNKRVQIANHETKEWMRGQQHLYEELKDGKAGYLGARSVKRLITDCYGRGVVRGAVETTNLNINSKNHDPTAAESIKTAQVADIGLQYPVQLLRHIAEEKPWPKEPRKPMVDKRNPRKRKIAECPPWMAYGGRGQHPQVHQLCAYEFVMHYQIKQARHPYSNSMQEKARDNYEAELTQTGLQKVGVRNSKLEPETDYAIREEGGEDWLPLGKGVFMKAYRHDWMVARRRRPHVPVIFGAQSSRTMEEQAMRILLLYFPWVTDASEASPAVPFINDLWQPSMKDWTEALLSHVSRIGYPTQEVKRLVLNFVFTHCLPRQTRLIGGLEENSDNEDLADDLVDFKLEENDLLQATLTHVRGSGCEDAEADEAEEDFQVEEGEGPEEERASQGQEGAAPTRLYDMTMDMFRLSGAIWQNCDDDEGGNEATRQNYEETVQRIAANAPDDDVALEAARASSKPADDAARTGLIGEVGAELEAGGHCLRRERFLYINL